MPDGHHEPSQAPASREIAAVFSGRSLTSVNSQPPFVLDDQKLTKEDAVGATLRPSQGYPGPTGPLPTLKPASLAPPLFSAWYGVRLRVMFEPLVSPENRPMGCDDDRPQVPRGMCFRALPQYGAVAKEASDWASSKGAR